MLYCDVLAASITLFDEMLKGDIENLRPKPPCTHYIFSISYYVIILLLFTAAAPLPSIKSFVEKFDDMLEGDIDNLPPKPPSEVRIFLSSTFSGIN